MSPALVLATVLAAVMTAHAGPPSWATRDTQVLTGSIYRAVCSGTGASIGYARQDAIDNCKMSAAQYLKSEFQIKSLSVSSERGVAYQQEVTHRTAVSGLICIPKHEEIEETETSTKLWLLCEFDLSRARSRTPDDERDSERPKAGRTDRGRSLTVASIPMCSDLIVITDGTPARAIPCSQNPMSIAVEPGDREIIVRSEGYFPKSIHISANRSQQAYAQVILDPNQ